MIFLLKNEILQNASIYKNNLEFILESFYRGEHIVDFESFALVNEVLAVFNGNTNIMKAINYYKSKRQDIKSLRKQVEQYVEVGLAGFSIINSGNQKIVNLPIAYFVKELSPVMILSENMQDCTFYISMFYNAKYFKVYSIPEQVKLMFDFDNGGGCGTDKMLEYRIQQGRTVLCIVDSDKITAASTLTGTPDTVQTKFNSLSTIPKIADIYILNVREKENLIPPKLYRQFEDFVNYDLINHLSGFHGTENEELLGYVKISDKTPEKLKTKNDLIFDKLSLTSTMRGIGKDGLTKFATNKIYTEELANHPQMIISYDIKISNQNVINIFQDTPEYLQDDYKNIISKIYAFACSLGKIRIS
ncbi:hypothetical protein JNE33_09820 [Streptococcus suis]|uniref:hypothetical protein n=1 Tax=Streptococcus suis TaxID=1307 RepID=UPI00192DEFFA|nr:hypothetical protein [Streptococcus suis]MBL6440776.1 hypothetical protein [Streptococcus suis]